MPLHQQNWIEPDSLRTPSNTITDLGIFRAGAAALGKDAIRLSIRVTQLRYAQSRKPNLTSLDCLSG